MAAPNIKEKENGNFYGFHIHEGESCTGDEQDPFKNVGCIITLKREYIQSMQEICHRFLRMMESRGMPYTRSDSIQRTLLEEPW